MTDIILKADHLKKVFISGKKFDLYGTPNFSEI